METALVKSVFLFLAIATSAITPRAEAAVSRAGLIDATSLSAVTLDHVVQRVEPGGVFIISEQHGNQMHYAHQREALSALKHAGRCTVSVGLEFLTWPYHSFNAPYLAGQITEADFLTSAKWPGNPFADYRDQALFPKQTGGQLVSINAPESLVKAIVRTGIAGLAPELAQQMPPSFQRGSSAYRERFDEVMAAHVPPSALDRYFEAQSVWDETMAWRAIEFLRANPTHCLAIIVGDFHAAWGGGLPERLRARGLANLTVVSQLDATALTSDEFSSELGPHPRYGARADAVWVSESPTLPAP